MNQIIKSFGITALIASVAVSAVAAPGKKEDPKNKGPGQGAVKAAAKITKSGEKTIEITRDGKAITVDTSELSGVQKGHLERVVDVIDKSGNVNLLKDAAAMAKNIKDTNILPNLQLAQQRAEMDGDAKAGELASSLLEVLALKSTAKAEKEQLEEQDEVSAFVTSLTFATIRKSDMLKGKDGKELSKEEQDVKIDNMIKLVSHVKAAKNLKAGVKAYLKEIGSNEDPDKFVDAVKRLCNPRA